MEQGSERYLRATDAFIWNLERDPLLRFTISAVALLDRAPDWDRLVSRFDVVTRLAPRFRQRVVSSPYHLAPPRWVVDPHFDLSFHVRRVAAPEPGTLASALDLLRVSAMGGLDRDRPLWEATLVEGLEGGRAALTFKLHHSLTDGIGGMQLAMLLFDTDPDSDSDFDSAEQEADPAASTLPPAPEVERLSANDLLRDAAAYRLNRMVDLARGGLRTGLSTVRDLVADPRGKTADIARTVGSIATSLRPINETASTVMRGRGFSWRFGVVDVPFDDLRRAAKATGGTLNDAFLAGITGGMRRYHEHHGAPVGDLRMGMPISLRQDDDPIGGNRVTVMRFTVPVGVADPKERLPLLHDAALSARGEPAVQHFNGIAAALVPITPAAVGPMAKHVDFGASNVPGYPHPVYLCGSRLVRYYPFGPTGGTSVNITMISYNGTCCVGATSDTAAVTDGDLLHQSLADGFSEVLRLGGDHAPVVVGGPQ